jgi:TonB family protein
MTTTLNAPVRRSRPAALVAASLICLAAQGASAGSPQATGSGAAPTVLPDNALPARFALRFDPASRCPDLRKADIEDPSVAVVVFVVGPSGVPSQPAIRTSSGAPALDAAAIDCVMKLRFRPATSLGEGTPVSSWQQAAWRWAKAAAPHPPETAAAAVATPVAPALPTAGAATAGASSTSAAVAGSPPRQAPAAVGTAEVQVCVDAAGKLTRDPALVHSSGDPSFDAAALRIARSGSGHYRPAMDPGGHAVPGCEQLSLRLE